MLDPTTEPFVIAGAGGYGCELVVACRTVGREPLCVLDDGTPSLDRLAETGIELGGTLDDAPRLASRFLAGVGYPDPRIEIVGRLTAAGLVPAPPVVHPSAVLMGVDGLPDGTVVFPNATISRGARIGANVLVSYNASVGHDTIVGDHATVNPGAQVGGDCVIGRGALIGSGAVVLQGLKLGDHCVVGSGAVVTSDVAAGATVVGVPARPR